MSQNTLLQQFDELGKASILAECRNYEETFFFPYHFEFRVGDMYIPV